MNHNELHTSNKRHTNSVCTPLRDFFQSKMQQRVYNTKVFIATSTRSKY